MLSKWPKYFGYQQSILGKTGEFPIKRWKDVVRRDLEKIGNKKPFTNKQNRIKEKLIAI